MTQERTPRAALDTKDNKDLTVPWHHDNIIYFLVLHKPFMCENFNIAIEADKNQKFLLPFSTLLRTVNGAMSYTPEVLRFLLF